MSESPIGEYLSPKYKWIYRGSDWRLCTELARRHNIPVSLAETLIKREISDDQQISEFFETPLNSLINPFIMKDMKICVNRICKAVENSELICIFGDYDVDGVSATSLLYLFFKELEANVTFYIPNRLEEGYGLNIEAIEELARKKVKLIVTVDCGISAVNEVAEVKKQGMEIIITDHHQPGDALPKEATAIINPMQAGDEYPFKGLSGVGVAFKVCMAVRHTLRQTPGWGKRLPNLKQYLDIVTLGSIADVMPLRGENRTFVSHGLRVLASENARPGIIELRKVSGVDGQPLSSSHVGFSLAPRINAVGRLGDSDRGFRLLTTLDRSEARRLAAELDQENKFRQGIEREIITEVFDRIDAERLDQKYAGLTLHSQNWHPGVLGIVASRVADKYRRPAIILTEEGDGFLKGSARSVPGFHLYDGFKEIADILTSFGGHKYAAGLKVAADKIDLLQDRFDSLVRERLTDMDSKPEISVDALIEPEEINSAFMETLQKFEPCGSGNKEPLFCMRNVEKFQSVTFVGKDSSHAKCYFIKNGIVLDAIGYDMRDYEDLLTTQERFDILFTLSHNGYGRSKNLRLVIKDLRKAL